MRNDGSSVLRPNSGLLGYINGAGLLQPVQILILTLCGADKTSALLLRVKKAGRFNFFRCSTQIWWPELSVKPVPLQRFVKVLYRKILSFKSSAEICGKEYFQIFLDMCVFWTEVSEAFVVCQILLEVTGDHGFAGSWASNKIIRVSNLWMRFLEDIFGSAWFCLINKLDERFDTTLVSVW